jgi:uncharacterized protein (DUF2062 family)
MSRVADFFQRRLITPVLVLLKQGISPAKLAQSLAFGTVVGVFPVLGVPTPALLLLALWLRLNTPAIQLVNYLVSPLQLLLIIPFVRVGERLTGAPPQPLTISGGLEILEQGAWQAIVTLWDAIVHAAIGWIAIGPWLIWLLYRICLPLMTRAAARMPSTESAPQA